MGDIVPHQSDHVIDANSTLRITMLGGFHIRGPGGEISRSDWRLRKAASVIKLLALSPGHQLHRDRIIEHLWPDLGIEAGLNNFYQALHVARRSIATLLPGLSGSSILKLDHQILALSPRCDVVIDVERFEYRAREGMEAGDPEILAAAIELYGGELLPDDLYDEWTVDKRRIVHETYVNLLLSLAQFHEARDEDDAATSLFLRVTAADPIVEAAHRGLMTLYARSGRTRLALRQYEELRTLLRSELGVQPDIVTRMLAVSIERDHRAGRVGNTTAADVAPRNSRSPDAGTSTESPERLYDAGVVAIARYAWEDAIEDLEAALDTLRARADRDMALECRTLLALGDAQARAGVGRGIELGSGHVPVARLSFLHAAELATELGHAEHLAHAALGVAGFCPKTTQGDLPGLHLLERALDGVSATDNPWHTRLLARLALYHRVLSSGEGRPQPGGSDDEIRDLSDRSVEMARRLGDESLLGQTLIARNLSEFGVDDLQRQLSTANNVARIAHQRSDYELLAWASMQQHEYAMALGYTTIAETAMQQLDWIAGHLRMPYFVWLASVQRAGWALGRGDLHTADARVEHAEQTWPRTGAASWMLFALRREQGRLAELRERLSFISGRLITSPFQDAYRLVFLAETGHAAEARQLLEMRPVEAYLTMSRVYDWLPTALLVTDAVLALGDAAPLQCIYDALYPYADLDGYSPHVRYPTGAVASYLGRLATRLERWDDGERHLRRSLDLHRERGFALRELWDLVFLAELLLGRDLAGDRAEAITLLRTARHDADERGMTRLVEYASALLHQRDA